MEFRYQTKEFLRERSLNPNLFIVKNDESQGWIYDNMEGIVHLDIVYEFREEGYTENATDMAVLTNNPASIEQYFLFLINMYVQFSIYLQYQACQK